MTEHLADKRHFDLQQATGSLADLLHLHYAVEQDYRALLALAEQPSAELAKGFDVLRKHYPVRYEFPRTRFNDVADKKTASQCARLGFEVT